jgi:hypothetical protein
VTIWHRTASRDGEDRRCRDAVAESRRPVAEMRHEEVASVSGDLRLADRREGATAKPPGAGLGVLLLGGYLLVAAAATLLGRWELAYAPNLALFFLVPVLFFVGILSAPSKNRPLVFLAGVILLAPAWIAALAVAMSEVPPFPPGGTTLSDHLFTLAIYLVAPAATAAFLYVTMRARDGDRPTDLDTAQAGHLGGTRAEHAATPTTAPPTTTPPATGPPATAPPTTAPPATADPGAGSTRLTNWALVLGFLAVFFPLFLGIPAIAVAATARRRGLPNAGVALLVACGGTALGVALLLAAIAV